MLKIKYHEYHSDKARLLSFYEKMTYALQHTARTMPRVEDLMLFLLIETVESCLNVMGMPDENMERKLSFMNEAEELIHKIKQYRIIDYAPNK